MIEITQNVSDAQRVYDPKGLAKTLKGLGGGLGAKTGRYLTAPNKKRIDLSIVPDRPFQLLESRTEEGKRTRREIRQKEGRDSTLRGKDHKQYIPKNEDIANCLTTGKENIEKWVLKPNLEIRRLTLVECERLQGFPDGWTEGISDTQRYKCLGNAVTTNVIKWIGEQL
jgi:site-specific DNA-cytosine methylase